MNQEAMFKPALIGGFLLGMLSALPLVNMVNCACCAWVIGGGVLAAHLYVRSSPMAVTLGRGVLLGLFTGIIGAIVDTLFSIPLHFMMAGLGMNFAQQLREALEQVPNMPPESKQALRSILENSGSVGILFLILSGLMKVIFYGFAAMLGGAIGVALFEKRTPGSEPSTGAVYQPPQDFNPPPPPPPPPDIPSQP